MDIGLSNARKDISGIRVKSALTEYILAWFELNMIPNTIISRHFLQISILTYRLHLCELYPKPNCQECTVTPVIRREADG